MESEVPVTGTGDTNVNFKLVQIFDHCGPFQVLVSTLAYFPRLASALSLYFMGFGAYNPGWRCLDNATAFYDNTSGIYDNGDVTSTTFSFIYGNDVGDSNNISVKTINYTSGVVLNFTHDFKSQIRSWCPCHHVEFNSGESTIVTEFRLVCDRSWITPFITSLLMTGMTVGTFVVGYFGDHFGRKRTLYISVFAVGVLFAVSIFSISWEMFAAIQFLVGIGSAVLFYKPLILITEFIPTKWRTTVGSLPTWNIGQLLLCVFAVTTKDWSHVLILNALFCLLCFLFGFAVPESLKWLKTMGREKDAIAVAKRITKINKLEFTSNDLGFMIQQKDEEHGIGSNKKSTILDLFRKKPKNTSILGLSFFTINMSYFAATLGVAVLPGDLYVNMVIMIVSEVPANILAAFVPNIAGRKKTISFCGFLCGLSFMAAIFVDKFTTAGGRETGLLFVVIIGKILIQICFYTILVYVVELYPTFLRSTALGFAGLSAGLGSILAPYLIPSSKDLLFVGYLVMAVLSLIYSVLIQLLPETKGRPLCDTWEDDIKEEPCVKT